MFDFSTMGVFLYFLYPILLISISIYVSLTKETTLESYFFADRNTHWFVLGISFLTSTFFSPYILGFSRDGSISGFPIIYAVLSFLFLFVLGWFIAPRFVKMKISTLPEYFEKRFNRTCRYIISALYVFSNIGLRLLVILIAGNLLISFITGADAYFSLLFFLVISCIYLIIGGLQAEIYVGVIQIVFVAAVVTGLFFWLSNHNGGLHSAFGNFSFLNYTGSDLISKFSIGEIIFGLPVLAFWFLCADQTLIQKLLSARNTKTIRKAVVVGGLLQIIPLIVFVLPGMLSSSLSSGIIASSLQPDIFGGELLPEIFQGGLFIAIAAILIASFAGLFNSTTTMITFDFYRSFKPEVSERKLVLVGRLTTMILLCCAIVLIPLSQSMNLEFCFYLFEIFSYLIAVVAAVFITGLLSSKTGSASAIVTLVMGTLIVITRVILNVVFNFNSVGGKVFNWFINSSFAEFVTFIFFFSVVSLFVIQKFVQKQNTNKSVAKNLKEFFSRMKDIYLVVVKQFF